MNLWGYRVKNKLTESLERMGKCPRGYTHSCALCSHIRMTIDEFYFQCYDFTTSDMMVRPYKSDNIQIVVVTYLEHVIGEWGLPSYLDKDTPVNLKDFSSIIPLSQHVVQKLMELHTTGEIVMEFHKDMSN